MNTKSLIQKNQSKGKQITLMDLQKNANILNYYQQYCASKIKTEFTGL